jgi:Na+-driven multidrug efflux pump
MSRSAFRNELAAAGRLAVPVVISQLGMMLMGTVDTMMLGHLSAVALAAGALGNIFTYCLLNSATGSSPPSIPSSRRRTARRTPAPSAAISSAAW